MISSRIDDKMLIERCKQGDKTAFDQLVQKTSGRAYQYAYRLTRDSELASDVVAEAFVRVYKAIDNFKGDSAFTTWLYRILTNCFLDMRKKERARRTTSLDAPQLEEGSEMERQVEDDGPSPHELAESMARVQLINDAVSQLPDYQKAMITMYHVDMLSYEEIADALDVPIGTVKSRLNRARISLRTMLSAQDALFPAA